MDKQDFDNLWEEIMNAHQRAIRATQIFDAMMTNALRSTTTPHRSPTDIQARGMYPYQEPEQDEQGTYYGYKILHIDYLGHLASPRYFRVWNNGQLRADCRPGFDHMHGIHCAKRPDHPDLKNYVGSFHGSSNSYVEYGKHFVLVRCALSGDVVETEQGFRAEFAQIVGVLDQHGNWESYQDYQERADAHSRRTAEEERNRRRFYEGDWDTDLYPHP